MTISAYDRACTLLFDLRQWILEPPSRDSGKEEAYNKKLKELHDELDDLCRKAHTELFRYKHIGQGSFLEGNRTKEIDTVEDIGEMMGDYFSEYCGELERSVITGPELKRYMENDLISQSKDWLDANKECLGRLILYTQGQGAAPWWKKVKRYFAKHQIWLIPAIVGFIGTIVGPIIVFVIQKEWGD